MPFIFHTDPEIQIAYLKTYQHVLLSDLARLAASPKNTARPRAKLMIFDFLDGDLEVDLDATHAFTRFIKGLEQTGFEREPSAVLTTSALLTSFFDAFELILDAKVEYRKVFSTLDEAIVWYGMQEYTHRIHAIHVQLLARLRAEAGD
jgi:hypothetical protein